MLYKYRTIENFKFFVDIILKNRLFAAPYFDLNDPMEGRYIYSFGHPSDKIIRAIKGEKEKLRIVSLSRNFNNTLMWAHYANGHRGVAVGVEVNRNKYDIRRVNYSDSMFNLQYNLDFPSLDVAKRILSEKHLAWSYEEEERIFVEDGQQFAEVKVKEIILGSKMSTQNQGFVRELVSKINPNIIVKRFDSQDYELLA
ncbi:MAG: hypothetical protein JM58_14745 [Peptococcaceae bacterium BICA1-8]|nr:MAG: hypothetical protein JM58_14745 [Peptococcaceae bacterium BICA1-8]